jgi:hypothetical protein
MLTQRTDDEAVLMAQLDAVMKRSPSGAVTSFGEKTTPRRVRKGSTAATRVLGRAAEEDGAAAQEAGFAEAQYHEFPVKRVATIAGTVLFLLVVLALKPWGWFGGGSGPSSGPDETPEMSRQIERLREVLKDPDPESRRLAVVSIGRHTGRSAERLLVGALNDSSEVVRAETARTLAATNRRGTVRHISRLLSDTSPEVRVAAAAALEELTGYNLVSRIDWREAPDTLRKAIIDEFLENWRQ